jgi:hypothetical protein
MTRTNHNTQARDRTAAAVASTRSTVQYLHYCFLLSVRLLSVASKCGKTVKHKPMHSCDDTHTHAQLHSNTGTTCGLLLQQALTSQILVRLHFQTANDSGQAKLNTQLASTNDRIHKRICPKWLEIAGASRASTLRDNTLPSVSSYSSSASGRQLSASTSLFSFAYSACASAILVMSWKCFVFGMPRFRIFCACFPS